MKKLILSTVAVATLATASFASTYDDISKKKDFNDYISKSEVKILENGEFVGYKAGQFYDKAGVSISYSKALDVNINELATLTYLNAQIGTNGKDIDSVFADVEVKTLLMPFLWSRYKEDATLSDVIKSGIAVTGSLKGTTFSHEKERTISKEIIHEDSFGWDTWTETVSEKVKTDERTSDVIASIGIYFFDTILNTGSDIELSIGKGLMGNIDSEVSLKTNTMINNDWNFTVEAKRTNVDSESYNTVNFGLAYKF